MLTKEAQKALIGWQLVSSKLISTVKFWTSHQRIISNIIQCYAPTSEAIKWDFDQRLDGILETRKTEENHHLDGIYGCQSWGRQYQLEDVLMKKTWLKSDKREWKGVCKPMCWPQSSNRKNHVFSHKNHNATWILPDKVTKYQINLLWCKKFRISLKDARVKRGADAASDHHKKKLIINQCNAACREKTISRSHQVVCQVLPPGWG